MYFGMLPLYLCVCSRIHSTCGIVKDKHGRLFEKRSCYTYTLFLTAGYVSTATLNNRIGTYRETLDEFISASPYTSLDTFFPISVFVAPAQIISIVPENRTFF